MSETRNEINYAAPAPTAPPAAEGPRMSTPETLSGIFFEPGRTFEALRARPRFFAAALISLALFMSYYLLYMQRVGYENIVNSEIEVVAQASEMSEEDKAQRRNVLLMTVVKAIRYASPALVFALLFAVGGAIYLLGSMAMGKGMSYKQALSVWTYSSLPPLLLMTLANIILLFVRPPTGDAEIARGLNGLAHANGSVLVDKAASPVLATALGSIDLLSFYGLFLAAVGLRKVARMSSGAAWTVVVAVWLLGVIAKIVIAVLTKAAVV